MRHKRWLKLHEILNSYKVNIENIDNTVINFLTNYFHNSDGLGDDEL